jgi:hypothetical protein
MLTGFMLMLLGCWVGLNLASEDAEEETAAAIERDVVAAVDVPLDIDSNKCYPCRGTEGIGPCTYPSEDDPTMGAGLIVSTLD